MSPEKSETIAFVGKDPVRRKIVVDNKCLQQVNNFKCLGCKIAYENKKNSTTSKICSNIENFKQHI